MIYMKRNDYRDYIRKCVARAYDPNDSYSWDDFKHLDEGVAITPLVLTAYPAITSETGKWIDKLFDEEATDRNGNYMLRGYIWNGYAVKEKLGMTMGEGGNGYSWWAFNDEQMLIYTYCEGDTTLTLLKDRETYEREKERARVFYTEEL